MGEAARGDHRARARRAPGARDGAGSDALNDLVAAAILGLVQGLTEFLPVSSTAHLILVSGALGLDTERFGLSFDVALHLGTALAVLLYFARTWIALAVDLLRGRWHLPLLVIVGTIPAAIAGLLFESTISTTLRSPWWIVLGLVIGSIVFVVVERVATQRRRMGELSLGDAVFMGAAQAIALLPGISRSGITISAGLLRDLTREEATRFSFLLATPIILGAGVKTLLDARKAQTLFSAPDVLLVGFVVSFVSGMLAVAFLIRFLRRHSLNWFVGYRLLLAAVVALTLLFGYPV